MKQQAAFTGNTKLLKGALHCHTTRSDGKGSPEEVIALHKENGYDFMALTDHRNYNYSNFGQDMLIIPGMEMDANLSHGEGMVHCHHIVCIGPADQSRNGYRQDQRLDSVPLRKPVETQAMLDEIHANGNMTVYCHPEWSGTPVRDFDMLQGNFAMELWNSGCAIEDGLDTNNGHYWDDLLDRGYRIWGVATDDGHAMYQHCKGWVRVNAEKNVDAVLTALKDGAFYASTGPEFYDFSVDHGKVHVKCSPVSKIRLRHLRIPYSYARKEHPDDLIEEVTFTLRGKGDATYVRAEIMDAQGRVAWTNPIFLEKEDFE